MARIFVLAFALAAVLLRIGSASVAARGCDAVSCAPDGSYEGSAGDLAAVDSGQVGAAEISFEYTEWDFGTIREEDGWVGCEFPYRNTGESDLVLEKVTATCGCTRPVFSKESLSPGDSARIEVRFNPQGRKGAFAKSVSVRSNARTPRMRLVIKGEIVPKDRR